MRGINVVLCKNDFKDQKQWEKLMDELNWPRNTKCVEFTVIGTPSSFSAEGEVVRP